METKLQASYGLTKRQLVLLTVAALAGASVVMLLFVLPAEFRLDPTGFGRATGLLRLGGTTLAPAAQEAPAGGAVDKAADKAYARYYPATYRSDIVDIPLGAAGAPRGGDELEYKVHMNTGDSFVYSWAVQGDVQPEKFYFDFHGETPPSAGRPEANVIEYKQTTGTQSHGVLIAPIDGVHGWYFQNQSAKSAVVHLRLSGFYTLVPAGEYGNEARIEPLRPVSGK